MVETLDGLRTYFTTEDEDTDHVNTSNIPRSYYFGLHSIQKSEVKSQYLTLSLSALKICLLIIMRIIRFLLVRP